MHVLGLDLKRNQLFVAVRRLSGHSAGTARTSESARPARPAKSAARTARTARSAAATAESTAKTTVLQVGPAILRRFNFAAERSFGRDQRPAGGVERVDGRPTRGSLFTD